MTMRACNASLAALLMLGLSMAPSSAGAVPGGDLGTLHNGQWRCEYPGDAAAMPRRVADDDFRITPDSSYAAADGKGTGSYLLLGQAMTFTSGPFYGRSFLAQGPNTILQLDAKGKRTGVRCSHSGALGGGFANAPEAGVNGAN